MSYASETPLGLCEKIILQDIADDKDGISLSAQASIFIWAKSFWPCALSKSSSTSKLSDSQIHIERGEILNKLVHILIFYLWSFRDEVTSLLMNIWFLSKQQICRMLKCWRNLVQRFLKRSPKDQGMPAVFIFRLPCQSS